MAYLPIVWDSGYSKDIISEEIVRALGVNINKLNRPLKIMTASGDSLYILGTCNRYIKTQVTDRRRKILDCAVLRGNKAEREILVSLQNMKKFCIVHETFGLETIDDYVYNTSVAAPGALAHRLQRRTACNT